MTRSGLAYALPTLELPTDATDGSASPFLLPSPSSSESTPTEDFVEEVRENLADPHKRLYLPGRKWHSQRTLSRIAPALLPTPVAWLGRRERHSQPGASNSGLELPDAIDREVKLLPTPGAHDATGAEDVTRAARQEKGATGGPSLRDLPKLLPSPTASHRGDRSEASKEAGGGNELRAIRKLLPSPCASDWHGKSGPNADSPQSRLANVEDLLPTPTGRDGKGPNPNEREGGIDLPTAVKLLPTPLVGDAEGGRTSKGASRPDEAGLAQTVKLLPTPVVTDSFGSRRSTARTEEWTSNEGTTLTDALWELQGRETDTRGKLLPTPVTDPDSANGHARNLSAEAKLLPTPMANEENPGAGGELRAAITHGPERRNRTGTDSWGRPNRGRSSGEPTDPLSEGGRPSSDETHPDQLTISDASTPASPSGCSDTPSDGSQ